MNSPLRWASTGEDRGALYNIQREPTGVQLEKYTDTRQCLDLNWTNCRIPTERCFQFVALAIRSLSMQSRTRYSIWKQIYTIAGIRYTLYAIAGRYIMPSNKRTRPVHERFYLGNYMETTFLGRWCFKMVPSWSHITIKKCKYTWLWSVAV